MAYFIVDFWRTACLAVVYSTLRAVLLRIDGALCRGGTSESVCMPREMAAEEVGHL